DKSRGRHDFDRLRKDFKELTNHRIGVEPDGERVRTDKCAPEDSRRPVRYIVALERFEQRLLDFGLFGDLCQGDLLVFTPLAHSSAKAFGHGSLSRVFWCVLSDAAGRAKHTRRNSEIRPPSDL